MSTPALPIVQLTLRPGIIDLGWGHPDQHLLPVHNIRVATDMTLRQFDTQALMYGADTGNGALIEWLCQHIGDIEGISPAAEEVVITGGASHALDTICTLYTRAGDTVLIEAPTYHLAMKILRDHHLNLVPVPMDTNGIIIEAFEKVCRQLRQHSVTPRFLYTIPTFHNPTGTTLPLDRRQHLLRVAGDEGVLIVEDDVYRELTYGGMSLPSLWSLSSPDQVLRIGSFSKVLAPGLRLGWITASPEKIRKIAGSGVFDSGGGINHFTAMVVATLCRYGNYPGFVGELCQNYRSRRDTMLKALTQYMPECRWEAPNGGFFFWVNLPQGVSATALLTQAEANGVSFLPGTKFYADGMGDHMIRLAFSLYNAKDLNEGVRRLGKSLTAMR